MASIINKVLAKPSGAQCCKAGALHEGEPRGKMIEIAGVETYIVEPPAGAANGNILLYYPDAFGFFKNGFLVMDAFADAGYLTLALDYFRGDGIDKHMHDPYGAGTMHEDFDFPKWRAHHLAFSEEKVPLWTQEVQAKYGKKGTKYACVGYCWGAPFVCDQLAEGGICKVGGFAHPAFLNESHFTNLKRPLYLSCAEIDDMFNAESRVESIQLLEKHKKTFQYQLISGVAHGFALRGDNSPYARYTKEQSLNGLAQYFDFWLSQ